jgi:crossover junction endodeoxyribonuclease RusA
MVEIAFPLEFLVRGTPVSSQSKTPRAVRGWKKFVRDASFDALPSPHFVSSGKFAVTIFYFPVAPMQGDIDNIVKPILDALCKHVYLDDKMVDRVLVQKFEPKTDFVFSNPTSVLSQGIKEAKPILYVRISTDPHEDLR